MAWLRLWFIPECHLIEKNMANDHALLDILMLNIDAQTTGHQKLNRVELVETAALRKGIECALNKLLWSTRPDVGGEVLSNGKNRFYIISLNR